MVDQFTYTVRGEAGPTIYTCGLYQMDIDAYVVSKDSGDIVAHKRFPGGSPDPSECPKETDHNVRVNGDSPPPSAITSWVLGKDLEVGDDSGLVGTFTNSGIVLTFNDDGTWIIVGQNTGSFIVSGNEVLIEDDDNKPDSCPPNEEPGIYEWGFDGQFLTFTEVIDLCSTGRIQFFTTGKWQLQAQ